MNTKLSMPSTISRSVSVRTATQAPGCANAARMEPDKLTSVAIEGLRARYRDGCTD